MYVEYGQPDFENHDAEIGEVLARALGFSAAELAGNRGGHMSTAQKAGLLKRATALVGRLLLNSVLLLPILAGLACLVGALGVVFRLGVPMNVFDRGVGRLHYTIWSTACCIGSLLLALAGVLGRKTGLIVRLFRLAVDLAVGRVVSYSGRVTTNRSSEFDDPLYHGVRSYFLCTMHEKYEVPREVYEELYEDITVRGGAGYYTLYFTPRSRFLVSAELATAAQVAGYRRGLDTPTHATEPRA